MSCLGCLFYFVVTIVIPLKQTYLTRKIQDKQSRKMWAVYWGIFTLLQTMLHFLHILNEIPLFESVIMLFLVWIYHPDYKGGLYLSELVIKVNSQNQIMKKIIQFIGKNLGFLSILEKNEAKEEEKKKAD